MAAAAERLSYTDVDSLAEVAAVREELRYESEAIIEARREHKQNGEYIPLPVDALSTAQAVLAARAEFGEASSEFRYRWQGLWLDCHRLLTEWYRKNTDEYFPRVYREFDPETEDFFSHGFYIGQMTYAALTPQEHPEFEARRVRERVAQATPHLVRKLGNVATTGARIRNISECADTAIAAYEHDFANGIQHQGYNGFVPEIEKVMIYDFIFDEASEGRFDEQIGLPGIYLNHAVFQEALRRKNINAGQKDKTDLLGTQILAYDDLIEFVKLLDQVGSEHWGVNLFKGAVVPANHAKDYNAIRQEAAQRQEQLRGHSTMLADFVLSLAEDGTHPQKAPEIVEGFVKKMLLTMARGNPAIAEQVFGKQTAVGLLEVAYLETQGLLEEAALLYQQVEKAAPGGGFCGAGSCGLEAIALADYDAVKKLGFGNAKDVIKDTERRCKCGSKTVFYDLKQAKKGCTSCGKTIKY